jgi:methanogenic corrinoid protein MtbC1
MFAELIRSFGVSVIDLGGSPDIDSFSEAVRRHEEAVVVISVTGPGHEAGARAAVDAVRDAEADIPIAIGGGAIRSEGEARDLGATIWHHDVRVAARQIADAAARRRQHTS